MSFYFVKHVKKIPAKLFLVKKHGKTHTHKENLSNLQLSNEVNDKFLSFEKNILKAELQMSSVCCSSNIPPITVHKLLNNIREIDKERIWDHMRLGAKKVIDLIVNVIGNEDKRKENM